jgi:hypothetical protein
MFPWGIPAMSLEDKIRGLCEDILACRDEAEAVTLARELGMALHQHIKQMRRIITVLPDPDSPTDIKAA